MEVCGETLANFPWPDMAQRVVDTYFIPGRKAKHTPFKLSSMPTVHMKRALIELMVIGNFVEVFLAKEGHHNLVGINYLEKIQLPTLPSLLGAMLAGVDFVLMGAGLPSQFQVFWIACPAGRPLSLNFM